MRNQALKQKTDTEWMQTLLLLEDVFKDAVACYSAFKLMYALWRIGVCPSWVPHPHKSDWDGDIIPPKRIRHSFPITLFVRAQNALNGPSKVKLIMENALFSNSKLGGETEVLKEIRIHGRGGQGGVTAAEMLARAAFKEGKWVQAFPFFGAERRGAPVKAFVRLADGPILVRSQVYNPDYVIVLDPALLEMVDVAEGLKNDGIVIVNTVKNPKEMSFKGWRVATVDATGIALELQLLVAGLPVLNTTMLGAFARATEEVKLESVLEVIRQEWSGATGEKNVKGASLAYDRLVKGW